VKERMRGKDEKRRGGRGEEGRKWEERMAHDGEACSGMIRSWV
jgi:hypothetical protein